MSLQYQHNELRSNQVFSVWKCGSRLSWEIVSQCVITPSSCLCQLSCVEVVHHGRQRWRTGMRNILVSSTSHLFIQVVEVKTEVGVNFVLSFQSSAELYQVSVEARGYLYLPLSLKICVLKKCAQRLPKNASICFFLIAQSVLNVQNFHSFPTRLCLKAKNSKQAS
jgi:SNF family Na+-dependent transporter